MERTELAATLHSQGYSCTQAVACAFADVVGLPTEQLAALCSCFGGGFKAKEICGVISGAAVVLGARWPHKRPEDKAAKELASEKMKEFNRAFLARFPGLTCRDLKDLPPAVEKSPASQRLGVDATCRIYVIAAVEILEEMLAAE